MAEIDIPSLQKEIDHLDRQLGEELAKTHGRTKRIQANRGFPLGSWILSVVLVGLFLFGGSIPGLPYEQFSTIILIVAGLSVLLSLFLTFRFVWSNLAGGGKVKQVEDTDKAVELRTKRDALKKKLEEMKAAKGV